MSRFWIQQHNPANGGWIDSIGFPAPMRPEAERALKDLRENVSIQSSYRLIERTDTVVDGPEAPEVDEDRLGFGLEPAEGPTNVCPRCGIKMTGGHMCGSCGRNV